MSADLGLASVNSSRTAEFNSLDRQINSAINTAKINTNSRSRAISGRPPVDVKTPKLAYTVTFPEEKETAIVPHAPQQSLGAPLPSNQGFVDWLCAQAVKEVRKLPGGRFLPQKALQELCVIGVNSGLNTIPALKRYVKSQLKMPRLSLKPTNSRVAQPQLSVSRATSAMRSMNVSAPVAIGRRVASRNKPRFLNRNGNVVISHTEFVGNLYSSGTTLTYNSTSFVINPGNCGTFPWLSTFSSNFDKYKIHKLIVHIVSNQPTSIAGRIGVGVDYDSTDPLPADRGEFFNLTHHQETSPWDSLVISIPIKPEEKFINSHTVTDSKLIDCGQIIVMADQIVATNTNLADIIIEYVVELIQPQQAVFMTQIFSGDHPAAFSALTVTGPVIGKLIATSSTTVMELSVPAGYYYIGIYIQDAGAASPTVALAVHNCVGFENSTATSTSVNRVAVIKASGPDSKLRFTFGSVAIASLEEIHLAISRISAAVYVASPLLAATSTY